MSFIQFHKIKQRKEIDKNYYKHSFLKVAQKAFCIYWK